MSERAVRTAVFALADAIGQLDHDLGVQVRRTPVNVANGYACVLRGVANFEAVVRVRWSVRPSMPLSRAQATVLELAALTRLVVMSATLNPSDLEWLAALEMRAAALVGRLKAA